MKKINLIKPERYVLVKLIKKEKLQVDNVVNTGIDKILMMLKSEFTKVNKKYDMILDKIDKNDNDVSGVNKKMELLLKKMNEVDKRTSVVNDFGIKNIVREKLELDRDLVIKYLGKHSIISDVHLVKMIYMKEGIESINYISERRLEYWKAGRWVLDRDGLYIREIFADNLKRLYTGVNYMGNFSDLNMFMLNQKHIISMGTDKYKKKFIKELKRRLI